MPPVGDLNRPPPGKASPTAPAKPPARSRATTPISGCARNQALTVFVSRSGSRSAMRRFSRSHRVRGTASNAVALAASPRPVVQCREHVWGQPPSAPDDGRRAAACPCPLVASAAAPGRRQGGRRAPRRDARRGRRGERCAVRIAGRPRSAAARRRSAASSQPPGTEGGAIAGPVQRHAHAMADRAAAGHSACAAGWSARRRPDNGAVPPAHGRE